jgi:hypothetical protein
MMSMTYQVNSLGDANVSPASPASGVSTYGTDLITLRSAIEAVNYEEANNPGSGPFTIDVPSGTYHLTLGELDLAPSAMAVTIAGQGATLATIVSFGSSRDLELLAGGSDAPVTLENLAIENGFALRGNNVGHD